MATGQTLLNLMELLNQELQLQAGETDVTRGLIALNAAQDQFEVLAALRKGVFGGQTGNVATVSQTETTTFPTGFMRVDRLQTLDANSNPDGELTPMRRTGGHVQSYRWPLNITLPVGSGKPRAYWTNGTYIYWAPRPDAVYSVRVYGFKSASDISASGTFSYPDAVMLPLAAFAVKLGKIGLEDSVSDISSLAMETFRPVLDQLENFYRDGSRGLSYTEVHNT